LIEKEPLEVKAMLDESSSSIMLLDVREKWEFDLCHIPKSIHMPIAEVILRISELEKDKPCHHNLPQWKKKSAYRLRTYRKRI